MALMIHYNLTPVASTFSHPALSFQQALLQTLPLKYEVSPQLSLPPPWVFAIASPSFFISGPGRSFKTFPYSTVSFVFQLIHRLAFLFIQSEPLKCSCSFSAAFKGIFRKCELSFFLPERHPRRFACIVKYL